LLVAGVLFKMLPEDVVIAEYAVLKL